MWLGKAVGGILGLATAGPVGSLLGVILGHQFDQSYTRQAGAARSSLGGADGGMFLATTFAVMGHIAKADGRVSEREIDVARRIMHELRLDADQVRAAIGEFTRGKSREYPLGAELATLKRAIGRRRDLSQAFVELQTRAVIAAGGLDQTKRELLWRVAQGVGVGRAELAQIEALVRAREQQARNTGRSTLGLEEAYRVLGVAATATHKEIKTAYRRLMNQHHPDKLIARGLPRSLTADAEQKTRSISAAYERIKSERGIK